MKCFPKQDGFTLVETLVAMGLFLGVLIPMLGAIGHLMLDRRSEDISYALIAAQSEMNRIEHEHDYHDAVRSLEKGMRIERSFQRQSNLTEATIIVTSSETPGKRIVQLHKSFLVYQ